MSDRLPAAALLRGLIFFILMLSLVGGGHVYLGLRFIRDPQWSPPVVVLGWSVLAAFFLSIPGSFLLPRLTKRALKPLTWTAHFWLGTFGLLLTSTLAADLVRWIVEAIAGKPAHPELWIRVWALGILGTVAGVVIWGVRVARGPPRVERVEIPVQNLPEGLQGLRIVQISDIHVGQMHAPKFLERIVETVNGLEPDIVAVTGDLVDGFVPTLQHDVAPLSGLHGKLGVFFVTGNHEYYWGALDWMAEVRRLGLTVLHNEHCVLTKSGAQVVVAGVPDHEGGHFYPDHAPDPRKALAGAPPAAPRILLAHQPKTAFRVGEGDRVDIQLSGHTHAGQIFPFNAFVKLQQPVIRGLARLNGVLTYTNQGTGFWGPPIRVGTFPEVTQLTLVRS